MDLIPGWVKALVLLAAVAAVIYAADTFVSGVEKRGYDSGVSYQKAEDQKEFDKVNSSLTKQKADAANLLQAAQKVAIALAVERDKFKTKLETQYEQDQSSTNRIHTKYFSAGLFFTPALQGSGCGGGCSDPLSSGRNASGFANAASVQLPGPLTNALHTLVYDADNLADAYRKCYTYATRRQGKIAPTQESSKP